jgi:heptosyltransferase-2
LPEKAHHIFQYLHLVEALGASGEPAAPHVRVTDEEIVQAKNAFFHHVDPAIPWIGICAGAEYGPAKHWPIDRFVQTAVDIHHQTGCAWILVGGPGDVSINSEIQFGIKKVNSAIPVLDLAGRTSLRQLACVLKQCRTVLSNDSGPMHLAAALGIPVVALFGSTSKELTEPGYPAQEGAKHELLWAGAPCSPCFLRECPIDFRCMTALRVTDVAAAVLRALA